MDSDQTPPKRVSTENMVRWGIIALVAMVALITAVIVGPKLAQGWSATRSAAEAASAKVAAEKDAAIAEKMARAEIESEFPGIELATFEASSRDGAEALLRRAIGVEQFADNAVSRLDRAGSLGECYYFTFSGSSPKGDTSGIEVIVKTPSGEWKVYTDE